MKLKWTASVCAVLLGLAMAAAAQNGASGTSNSQDNPVLKTRPQVPAAQADTAVYTPPADAAPPDALPEGKRFIIKLKDTLDTRKLKEGKHFKAELREDLVTPSGLVIPRGRNIRGHIARFERGYMGARMMLAMDEIATRHG